MAKSTQDTKARERPAKRARTQLPAKEKSTPKPKLSKSTVKKATSKAADPIVEEEDTQPVKVKETTQKAKKSKGKAREENTPLPTSFKVVAGSYEKLLYGLEGTVTVGGDSNIKFELKPTFIFPAHVSCIKAVAASPQGGKWLATGSADEIIKVWDLRRRKEIGGLLHHEGSITHLLFPSRSHLLSASEDGTLCLFRARDWAVLRSLKGHKGRVNSVAVHPSGKVGLSVGKDKALRMWDFMRGKGVASTKLGKEGELVRWSTDGSKFLVQSGSTMDVYATNMELLYTITHPSRIQDTKFCSRVGEEGELLFVAAEDRKLTVYDVPKGSETPTIVAEMIGHTNRVKAVQTLEIALPEASGRKSTTIACTVSSDGFVNVYDVAAVSKKSESTPQQIKPLGSYDSQGTRLTCVTLADGEVEGQPKAGDGKRKRTDDDDGEGSGSEKEDEESEDEEDVAFGAGWEDEEEVEEENEDEEEDEEESE
ncbi:WD40 repeat-like protein [Agrocybe pediades]|nr:WD40 repeat-like protein [Agrocybe pediades]